MHHVRSVMLYSWYLLYHGALCDPSGRCITDKRERRKEENKTKHHNSNFTLRAQSLALRCGYQTAAVCLFVFFVRPGRVTCRDINLHFSSRSDVCSQPLNLPYIPTACYMSERLLKVCHNDDDLFISLSASY